MLQNTSHSVAGIHSITHPAATCPAIAVGVGLHALVMLAEVTRKTFGHWARVIPAHMLLHRVFLIAIELLGECVYARSAVRPLLL